MVPEIRLGHRINDGSGMIVQQSSYIEGRDKRILRRFEGRHFLCPFHQLVSDRIVVTVVPITDVLLRQRIVWIGGTLVSVTK